MNQPTRAQKRNREKQREYDKKWRSKESTQEHLKEYQARYYRTNIKYKKELKKNHIRIKQIKEELESIHESLKYLKDQYLINTNEFRRNGLQNELRILLDRNDEIENPKARNQDDN